MISITCNQREKVGTIIYVLLFHKYNQLNLSY